MAESVLGERAPGWLKGRSTGRAAAFVVEDLERAAAAGREQRRMAFSHRALGAGAPPGADEPVTTREVSGATGQALWDEGG